MAVVGSEVVGCLFQILEQSRGATSAAAMSNLAGARRDDHYPEFRVGRIKHERIKVTSRNV